MPFIAIFVQKYITIPLFSNQVVSTIRDMKNSSKGLYTSIKCKFILQEAKNIILFYFPHFYIKTKLKKKWSDTNIFP